MRWQAYVRRWNVSPYLDGCSRVLQSSILATFAVGVRSGDYGLGHRVTTQTVDRAIRAVGQTLQLAGQQDPTKIDGGRERIIQLRRLCEVFRREDPPPKPQLAVPISVVEHLQAKAEQAGRHTSAAAVADLATVTFFFLLRVGEYTMPQANRLTRTVQFRVRDVMFYRGGLIILNTAPLSMLLQADGVALRIDNQKNGTRGETVYQHALGIAT